MADQWARETGTTTVEATGLTKRFGARTAVSELSFSVRAGEVVGLLGPNGSGKTTTIRMLTTLLPSTAGRFSVAGIPDSRPVEIRARVGVLPESAGYPGHQTGREYLRYHARLYGAGTAEAGVIADRLLADMGLADRATTRVSTYSRGMRQRLGIARALVNDPTVVFLDEPTLGLDPAGQRHVLRIVRDVAARRGASVVLSTHSLSDVEAVCDNVLILKQGRLRSAGTVADIARTVPARFGGLLQVSPDTADRARAVLDTVPGLVVETTADRPDLLRVIGNGRDSSDAALRAVLDSGVTILSYQRDGGRFGDAFLELTAGPR
jgi:ABC-2 type transport system ATP-binding protein